MALKRKSEQTKGDLKLLQGEYEKFDQKKKKIYLLSNVFFYFLHTLQLTFIGFIEFLYY